MNKRTKVIVNTGLSMLLLLCVVFSGFANAGKRSSNSSLAAQSTKMLSENTPKYVFLFIGDGMGLGQINTAEIYNGVMNKGTKNGCEIEKLAFTKFPVEGMCTTYEYGSFITDSASAGTAIATGNKTLNGIISMDPETQTKKYTSIAKIAKEKGMKVGIVTSVSLDHATPAVFYANEPSRNNYYNIGMQLTKSNFDYFAGGGFKQSKGKDGSKPDLIEEAKKNGYTVVNTKQGFNSINPSTGKVIAMSPKLDEEYALPYAIDNDNESITLADFTKKGIQQLDNKNGFFMMVEGGKIDWTCHANDAATSIKETVAFEDSIKEALKFYEKHPKETLIIVTADHETGGLTIGFAGTKYSTYFDKFSNVKTSYDAFDDKVKEYKKTHTPENANLNDFIPLLKEKYGLVYMDNKEYDDLKSKAGNKDKDAQKKLEMALTPSDVSKLKTALKASMSTSLPSDEETYLLYGGYDPFTIKVTEIINNKAGVAFTTYSHTGVPVPIYATGAMQEVFNGYYDNTDIFTKLCKVMGFKAR